MKILKLFGLVLTVHVAVFLFVFAIPGCRSTTRRAPQVGDTKPSDTQPSIVYPGLTGYREKANASTVASQPVINDDLNPLIAPAPVEDFSLPVTAPADPAVRFNPTRPATPAASALQTGSVTDVQRVTTYTVAPRDSLWTVARKHGVTVGELEAANNLKPGSVLQIGKKLIIPEKLPAPGATEAAGGIAGDTLTYTVQDGDTLGAIARRSGTTVGAIKTLNKLRGDTLRPGQKLTLPASADTAASVAASAATAPARMKATGAKHLVRPGETLSQIARTYGVSTREIGAANNLADPRNLRAGQELIIPGATASASPARAREPAAASTQNPPVAPAPNAIPATETTPSDTSPISAPAADPVVTPADQPPVVPVEGASPIEPAN
jgi:LysM repeat protein